MKPRGNPATAETARRATASDRRSLQMKLSDSRRQNFRGEIMKRKYLPARLMRYSLLLCLIIFACFASAQVQTLPAGGVIPRVCVDTTYHTGKVTLASAAPRKAIESSA
jgi:hypothetical protein